MPIDFKCTHCGILLRVDDSLRGQVVTCSQCNQQTTVPTTVPSANPYSAPLAPEARTFQQHAPGTGSMGDDVGMRLLLPVGRSVWAILAGYLGLLSVLGCPAPFALGCGIMALIDIKKNPQKHGLGRAWFGIIMGGLVTLLIVVMLFAGVMG